MDRSPEISKIGEGVGIMFNKRTIFVLSAICCLATVPALAADTAPPPPSKCTLTELASLPLSIGTDAMAKPTVPVAIEGSPASFIFGLAHPYTAITKGAADANKIQTEPFAGKHLAPFTVYLGRFANATSVIPTLTIGHAAISNVQALVLLPSRDADGVLGVDVLSQMDVEVNLKAGKINLFSQGHCGDQAVYWGRPYVAIPFGLDGLGVPFFRVVLDGQIVTAKLDIDQSTATMGRDRAETLFGITSATKGVTTAPAVNTVLVQQGPFVPLPSYTRESLEYTFKSLSMSGIAIHNLNALLIADTYPQECDGLPGSSKRAVEPRQCNSGVDIVIGRNELRNMRLFFSFEEKLLYITSADPDVGLPVKTESNTTAVTP